MGQGIGKEETLFSPGKALGEQNKTLTAERMKGMRDGKVTLTIRVIRCS